MQVSGTIATEPEAKTSKAGNPYHKFRLAESYGKGEDRHTVFYDVVTFAGKGEGLGKGDWVTIKGELKPEVFNRKNGDPGVALEVRAFSLEARPKAVSTDKDLPF